MSALCFAAPVFAQARLPAEVTLTQASCVGALYDTADLPARLGVELSALGVTRLSDAEPGQPAPEGVPSLAALHLDCSPTQDTVVIELADVASGKTSRREMVVSDVARTDRARALAIAVVELMASSWSELVAQPSAAQRKLPPDVERALRTRLRAKLGPDAAVATQVQAQSEREPRETVAGGSHAELAAVARMFPARSTALLGGTLGSAVSLSQQLRLQPDIEALFGSQELNDTAGRIGSMKLWWLTAGLGLDWISVGSPELAVGPLVRIGYARAAGSSERAKVNVASKGGVVSSVGARASLRGRLSRTVSAVVGIDLGYMPSGVVFLADLSRTAGMAELTLAVRIGLSYAL